MANTTDICILILYSAPLPNSCISALVCVCVCVYSWDTPCHLQKAILHVICKKPFQFGWLLFFSPNFAMARTSSKILKWQSWASFSSSWETFQSFTIEYDIGCGVFTDALYRAAEVPTVLIKGYLSRSYSTSIEMIMWVFTFILIMCILH